MSEVEVGTDEKQQISLLGLKEVLMFQEFPYTGIPLYTVGLVLIARFKNCVQVKSGQIVNPIIAIVDPVPYSSICARFLFANLLIANADKTRNSQLVDTRN